MAPPPDCVRVPDLLLHAPCSLHQQAYHHSLKTLLWHRCAAAENSAAIALINLRVTPDFGEKLSS